MRKYEEHNGCIIDAETGVIIDTDALGIKVEQLTRERDKALAEVKRLQAVVGRLLLSADCAWEERNKGHDWPEAVADARAALAAKTAD